MQGFGEHGDLKLYVGTQSSLVIFGASVFAAAVILLCANAPGSVPISIL